MSLRRFSVPVVVAGLAALVAPTDAWAYLDAGTGSYLFQLAVAGLLAGMMTVKIYWMRIKAWLGPRKAPPPLPSAADDSKPS
jgi:hypothetical protein